MNIQWFPGHMTKALRMMSENAPLVDSFIYVLDSRAYAASINETFNGVIGNKPILYVLNKADMIERSDLSKIKKSLEAEGKKVVTSNSKNGANSKEVIAALLAINKDRITRGLERGVKRVIRAMVIGIPNTGKSTLINSLCGGKKTLTGNRPGVTKGKQWVAIDDYIQLLDTPGTLCPSFDNNQKALNVAFIGSIKDDVINLEELSLELLARLSKLAPKAIDDRYKTTCEELTPLQIMDAVAKARGFILRGNEVDYERAYYGVIDDFRKGKLGKIALEVPVKQVNN